MSDTHEQLLQIVSLTVAMQDTLVSQGRKRSPPGAASLPLQLSNRYEALSQIGDALGGAQPRGLLHHLQRGPWRLWLPNLPALPHPRALRVRNYHPATVQLPRTTTPVSHLRCFPVEPAAIRLEPVTNSCHQRQCRQPSA